MSVCLFVRLSRFCPDCVFVRNFRPFVTQPFYLLVVVVVVVGGGGGGGGGGDVVVIVLPCCPRCEPEASCEKRKQKEKKKRFAIKSSNQQILLQPNYAFILLNVHGGEMAY